MADVSIDDAIQLDTVRPWCLLRVPLKLPIGFLAFLAFIDFALGQDGDSSLSVLFL